MYEFVCKNGNKILSEVELPRMCGRGFNKGNIVMRCKDMVGITLSLEYNGTIYNDILICKYIYKNNKTRFDIKYKDIIYNVACCDFLGGRFGGILNIDPNNKHIDSDGIVYIHIKNTKGEEFEALYSGNHVEEVMKANWHMSNHYVVSKTFTKGKQTKLQHVDFINNKNIKVVKHLNNNPLDNRIENLTISDFTENTKNKITNNKFGLTGLRSNSESGYVNRFAVDGHRIHTKTKHDLGQVKLDNLIAQRYLGYKHNEDLFHLLDDLSEERIKEVTDLLDNYIKSNKDKTLTNKEYDHNIEEKDGYYILHKNGKEMLFDCDLDLIKDKRMWENRGYWTCEYIYENKRVSNRFHREIMNLTPNAYIDYNIHIDHINHNHSDNRYENLIITSSYGNQCNKKGRGYGIEKGKYRIMCMCDYRFWDLIGGKSRPSFQTEQEAIDEVDRRRKIVDNTRVRLKSKEELDELIKYCLDNKYILDNGLADLDLGYLYWKSILKRVA